MLTLVAVRGGKAAWRGVVLCGGGNGTAYFATAATMAMAYTGGGAACVRGGVLGGSSNVTVAGRAWRRHGVLCDGGNTNGVYSCVYVSLL